MEVSFRIAGQGPTLVLVKPHRLPRDYPQLLLLADRYRVIQIEPLGFGDSPAVHPPPSVPDQVLGLADRLGVDRFAVWGYSQGGAMAAATAQATSRVTALVMGGFAPTSRPTDAWMARADRDQRIPQASRSFWHDFRRFDWLDELTTMQCPRLLYTGAEDRAQAPGLRRCRDRLTAAGATIIEFPGLDHRSCQAEPALSTHIVPRVVSWLEDSALR